MAGGYRVGIIGCGNIAKRHAKGYLSVEGLEIVAGAEPNGETSRSFQTSFSVPKMYSDPEEMLKQESLDIVSVCTWHLLHMPQTVMAAEHGVKAVLCEKPMSGSLAEADGMIAACTAHDTMLAIAHQRRFYPGWTEARRLIGQGAIGQPMMATGYVIDGLLNTGSHVVDGTRYVLGDPQAEWVMGAVERKSDRWEREVPIEDCCLGLTSYAGGVQSLIQVDLSSRNEPDGFTIQGTEGVMIVGPEEVQLISGTGGKAVLSTPWDPETETSANKADLEGFFHVAYAAQARGLKAWMDGEAAYRSEGVQTRNAMEIMMALYQSARAHEVVRMPLLVTDNPMALMIEEGKLPLSYPEKYDIRGPGRKAWAHRPTYDRLRSEGLSHPQILVQIFPEGANE